MKVREVMAAIAALLLLTASSARADGPLSLLTTIGMPAKAHDVVVAGNLGYVATEKGLTILDLTVPTAPTVRRSLLAGNARGLAVGGSHVYLATTTGLVVVNVANPDAPAIVGKLTISYAWDAAVKGGIAYVSTLAGKLYVVNVATPTLPKVVKIIGLPAWKTPGNDAYNLSRLNAGVTTGSAKATGVTVTGNHLVTVDWGYGRLYYFDVTTAAQPVFAGTHYVPYVLKAEVDPSRDTVYMLSAYGPGSGLYTVPLSQLDPNVSTAHATCALCRYHASHPSLDQGGLTLGAGGDYAIYGGGRYLGQFAIIDVSQPPPSPLLEVAYTQIGAHYVSTAQTLGGATNGDDVIYWAAGVLGVHVYQFPGLAP